MRKESKQELLTLLVVALSSGVILLLASGDSWLHDLHGRYDSGWFFTCGKSWMEGLRPYIDFADSKGPLLWLLYGIGYLISPLDYTGVWWLTWACYTATYYLVYRTARLFVPGRPLALTVMWLMTLAFFNPLFFNEIRAEDFCHLPLVALLYNATSLAVGAGRATVRRALSSGACLGVLFLIKYNIMAMGAAMALVELLVCGGRRKALRHALVMCVGAAVVVLPMLAYLWCHGELRAFVDEYLLNTAVTTVSNTHGSPYMAHIFQNVLHWHPLTMLYVSLLVAGTWLASRMMPRRRWVPWLIMAWLMALTLLLSHQQHHFIILDVLLVLPFTALVRLLSSRFSPGRVASVKCAVGALVLAVVVAFAQNFSPATHRDNFFTQDNASRREYYYLAGLMGQVERPTVLFYGNNHDFGVGTPVRALPCCKYWSLQAGATPEMKRLHEKPIYDGTTDFVVLYSNIVKYAPPLRSLGYNEYVAPVEKPRYTLFTKHKLKERDVKMSNTDVLLKRPIINTPPW